MKKLIVSLLMTVAISVAGYSQVGIGTTTPDPSSMLHVNSTNRGFLPPVMTSAQRLAILSPAVGLVVFDSSTLTYWYYKSGGWTEISNGGTGWSITGNTGDHC